MIASWTFVVGPWNGGAQHELTRARGRKLSFSLTKPSTVSFTLNGRHTEAVWVDELITDLHVLRRPTPGEPAERLFRGRVGTTADRLDASTHTVEVSAADYRALLARRIAWNSSPKTWTQTDQGVIVAALLADAQSRTGGDLGMVLDGGTTGVLRDFSIAAGDSLGDKIQALADMDGGFDWDVLTPSAGELVLTLWYPRRGIDRGVVLEYGGALVGAVDRQVDPATYANAVRVSGKAPSGGGTEPTPVELEAGDLGNLDVRPDGRWDAAVGEDLSDQTALANRAVWRLEQAQVIRPTYSLKLRPGAWGGPDHIWLGDTVRTVVYSGRLRVDTMLRVQGVDVSLSEEGDEAVSLTVGSPPVGYADRATDAERRLSTLERR